MARPSRSYNVVKGRRSVSVVAGFSLKGSESATPSAQVVTTSKLCDEVTMSARVPAFNCPRWSVDAEEAGRRQLMQHAEQLVQRNVRHLHRIADGRRHVEMRFRTACRSPM